ncbi:expressed unknown protein [Seminavis robusta]|uniref:Uncharacterized protein n=1 Tax=Seminavis robusta TaxID=568900 RepID=A0A9N8ESA8_9STRA|nr:expressed unknown protein [Seminavis robusta]|eukprot:Sro1541_g280950.1 n/a (297) ;mRNA; f:21633-22603
MSPWKDRLKALMLGINGTYDPAHRRSLQSVIMYEAQRCVKSKLPTLRPFQRKIAFYDQAVALLESLEFVPPHHQAEVMWRTATSRDAMDPDIAWKRSRLLEKELSNLAEKIKPFVGEGLLTHQQACDAMVQDMYENSQKEAGEESKSGEKPANWEHAHNNVMLVFRLYYKFSEPDPDFPPAKPAIPIVVPAEKPPKMDPQASFLVHNNATKVPLAASSPLRMPNQSKLTFVGGALAAPDPIAERSRVLKEVRDHLDLLKEFEGVIPEEDIQSRKRELFDALPPAPPPFEGKKAKLV